MLITLSGLDGAGKSTLAEALRTALEQDGTPAVILHMNQQVGLFAHLRTVRDAFIRVFSGRRVKAASARAHEDPDVAIERSSTKSMLLAIRRLIIWNKPLRRCVDWADLLTFLVYRIYIEKGQRRVLIMDRYFYDRVVDLADGRRWAYLRWFARIAPRPDVPVFVEVRPEDAFARKGEYTIASMTQRRENYLQIFCWIPGSVILANDRLDDTIRQLTHIVRERMVPAPNRHLAVES